MRTLDKRQKGLLLGIIGALALIVLLLLVPLLTPKETDTEPSVVAVIPEADLAEEETSKTASYRRGVSPGDYWDSQAEDRANAGTASAPGPDDRRPAPVGVDDLFGDYKEPSPPAGKPPVRKASGGAAAPKASVPPEETREEPGEVGEEPPATAEEARPLIKRSGAVSSLDEDLATELGNGFSTLDGTDRWVGADRGKPYRCMFTRDEKVRSGARITLRLLEDLVVGGVHVPRNTHLQGVVTVSDRMEIKVSSLDVGGRILSLRFEAYDTDGGKGIYCSDLSQAGRTALEQGIATVSSTLGSRLGRVARDAASVGASIIRNKSGEATVSVPAGYCFYIIEQQ